MVCFAFFQCIIISCYLYVFEKIWKEKRNGSARYDLYGRRYDDNGSETDWMPTEDRSRLDERISRAGSYFSLARPIPGQQQVEGISIVYSASDYTALRIEDKAESLRKEMIVHTSYIRFLHPEMPGYNAYWLWLG